MLKLTRQIEKLQKLKIRKDILTKKLKEISSDIEEVEEGVLDTMLTNSIQNVKIVTIGTVSISNSDYPRITDIPTFFEYLRENKQEGMIKRSVNSGTLRGWWNLLEDKPTPESIGLDIFSKTKISIRKG